MAEAKQVIVVRADLNMPVGKVAAQVAHAASMAILQRFQRDGDGLRYAGTLTVHESEWLTSSHTKVVVAVQSLEELQNLIMKACELNLNHAVVVDQGRTVFNGVPTVTCVAFGPDAADDVNKVTGHLPLYK